jgi:hypothetical protein
VGDSLSDRSAGTRWSNLVAPSKKGARMTKALYRSKFTIGMAWLGAPIFCSMALYLLLLPGASGLDAWTLLAGASTGLAGLLDLWILAKRGVPIISISDQTLELAPTTPFQKPRSIPIDEINEVERRGLTLLIDTQAGTVRFFQLGLSADDLSPILAAVRRKIEERESAAGGR